jgi:hypothetical protein
MRNPKDSWSLGDSAFDNDSIIGANDMRLSQTLIRGGSEHRKFLRQIFVSVDIVAPRYWWSEFDTYKIGTTANSCSTMHKLTAYPIVPSMFEIDGFAEDVDRDWWENTVNYLELKRQKYHISTDASEKLRIFRSMKQALPESFKQRRTVTMNYEVIYNQVRQRRFHKLSEWSQDYINWSKTLPYATDYIFCELDVE